MAIGEGLRTLLLAEGTITALCSTRIYLGRAPQKPTLPYLVMTNLRTDPLKALDGTYGMGTKDFDLDCVAATQPGAQALADAVMEYLDDYTGAAGSHTINAVLINDQSEDAIEPADSSDTWSHVVTVDATLHYTE